MSASQQPTQTPCVLTGAGRHVFSEKPLTATLAEGIHLVEWAQSKGLAPRCAPDTFLGGGGQRTRVLLDQDSIGHVLAGTAMIMNRGMEHWHPDSEFSTSLRWPTLWAPDPCGLRLSRAESTSTTIVEAPP